MTPSPRSAARLAAVSVAFAGLLFAAQARAAHPHLFTASYSGVGSAQVSGATASGSATMRGRGRPIGASTLSGSATGTFTSSTCVAFRGSATVTARRGSLRLAARGAQACASNGAADRFSFSGRARVVGGTAAFTGARGVLSFSGTYVRSTGAVMITFRGRITY